jgi:hypothetical protein
MSQTSQVKVLYIYPCAAANPTTFEFTSKYNADVVHNRLERFYISNK